MTVNSPKPRENFWKVKDQTIPKARFMFPPNTVDKPHITQGIRQNHQKDMTLEAILNIKAALDLP